MFDEKLTLALEECRFGTFAARLRRNELPSPDFMY